MIYLSFPYTYRMGAITHALVPYTNIVGILKSLVFLTLISSCLMTNIVVRFPEWFALMTCFVLFVIEIMGIKYTFPYTLHYYVRKK